jgi:hypothetical protein
MDATRSEKRIAADTPVEALELKAMQERSKLHDSIEELKDHYAVAKQKLDVKQNAKQHMTGAAVAVGVVGLLSGYAIAGAFTRY